MLGDCTVFSVVLLSAGVLVTGRGCDLSSGRVQWSGGALPLLLQYAVGRQCGMEHDALRQLAGEEESGNSSGEETDSMAARGQARNNLRP